MKYKIANHPTIGEERIVEKFLFFPTYANREWRWLEFVKIQQRYKYYYFTADPGDTLRGERWENMWFIN